MKSTKRKVGRPTGDEALAHAWASECLWIQRRAGHRTQKNTAETLGVSERAWSYYLNGIPGKTPPVDRRREILAAARSQGWLTERLCDDEHEVPEHLCIEYDKALTATRTEHQTEADRLSKIALGALKAIQADLATATHMSRDLRADLKKKMIDLLEIWERYPGGVKARPRDI